MKNPECGEGRDRPVAANKTMDIPWQMEAEACFEMPWQNILSAINDHAELRRAAKHPFKIVHEWDDPKDPVDLRWIEELLFKDPSEKRCGGEENERW